MKLTKTEKIICSVLLAVFVVFIAVSNVCDTCKMGNNFFAAYCNYCSEPLRVTDKAEPVAVPPEEAIIGQWKTLFEYYYEYEFFADGTCKGYYCGRNPDYEPCLHPEWYIFGSGDGTWYFEGNELVVVYSGEGEKTRSGSHHYTYEFNEDYTQLKIIGLGHDATWLKVPEDN